MGAHLPHEWQHIAPADQPKARHGNKVDAASGNDAAVVRERLLSRPCLGEREEATFTADGVEQYVKSLEVAFVERLEVH
jgi:hypothetical protein